MKRLPAVLVLALAAAGCTGPAATAPTEPAAPASAPAPAISPAATPEAGEPTESPTPHPLPSIPAEPVPGEVVRATFGATTTVGRAEHRFSGRPVSYHVLCASHDGEVAVELWAGGQEMIGSTNACGGEPFFTVEDASFGSGTKQVELRVQPSGGAEGLVYVVDGEI